MCHSRINFLDAIDIHHLRFAFDISIMLPVTTRSRAFMHALHVIGCHLYGCNKKYTCKGRK
jgi:hypothetical protein